jgi:asparagine synthase (glutamine-hydrolysing)
MEAALAADLRIFLSHGLNRLDKNMMQHSLELREPFLSADLVRFALNLPVELRLTPTLKGILLDLASKYLPEEIVRRSKVGFSFDPTRYIDPYVRDSFLTGGHLRELFSISIEVWKQFVDEVRGRDRFRLLTAEIWCRVFLENQTSADVNEELWRPCSD